MSSLTSALPLLPELTKVTSWHGRERTEVSGGTVEASGFQTPLRRILSLFGAAYLSVEEVDAALDIVYGMLELTEALKLCQHFPVALPLDLLV